MKLQLCKMDRKLLEEINYKIDTVIVNQGKLNRTLLLQKKKRLKPYKMPSLPLTNENDIQAMEKWLLCDAENNIALVCMYIYLLYHFGINNFNVKLIMQCFFKDCYVLSGFE